MARSPRLRSFAANSATGKPAGTGLRTCGSLGEKQLETGSRRKDRAAALAHAAGTPDPNRLRLVHRQSGNRRLRLFLRAVAAGSGRGAEDGLELGGIALPAEAGGGAPGSLR